VRGGATCSRACRGGAGDSTRGLVILSEATDPHRPGREPSNERVKILRLPAQDDNPLYREDRDLSLRSG
jgi:hypothetical protein